MKNAIFVTLCPNDGQAEWLEQTRIAVRTAVQKAFPIARRRRATSEGRVMGLARESLSTLPPDLAEGAAKSVAVEVATSTRQGPKDSAVLGIRCVKVKANGRLSILTVHGIRIKVPVAPEHVGLLAGREVRGATYLAPTVDGFDLCIPTASVKAQTTPSAVQPMPAAQQQSSQPPPKLLPYCKKENHGRAWEWPLDSGEVGYECDQCKNFVEVEWR
jgi:hypothetical protein